MVTQNGLPNFENEMKQSTVNCLERIWARSLGHYVGETDHDVPVTPILSMREARISLLIRTLWVGMHVVTCVIVVASAFKHWYD